MFAGRCANNLGLCGAGVVHQWAQFLAGREPNHPNRRAAIRSILIDFRCSDGLFTLVCAKLFRTGNTGTAAKLCAICGADHPQNSSAKRIRATIPQRQNPCFIECFLNSCVSCTSASRRRLARAIKFDVVRLTVPHHVTSRGRTRFVKR
jgi:hypothetical protein